MTKTHRTVTQGGCLQGQTEITIPTLLANSAGRDTSRRSFRAVTIPVIGLLQLEFALLAPAGMNPSQMITPAQALKAQVGIMTQFGAGKPNFIEAGKQICKDVATVLEADYATLGQCEGQTFAPLACEFVAGFIVNEVTKIGKAKVDQSEPTGELDVEPGQIEKVIQLLLTEAYANQQMLVIPGTARRSVWAMVYAAHLLEAKLLEPSFDLPKVAEFVEQVVQCVTETIPPVESQYYETAVAFWATLSEKFGLDRNLVLSETREILPDVKPGQQIAAIEQIQELDLTGLFKQIGHDQVIGLIQQVEGSIHTRISVGTLYASFANGLPTNGTKGMARRGLGAPRSIRTRTAVPA